MALRSPGGVDRGARKIVSVHLHMYGTETVLAEAVTVDVSFMPAGSVARRQEGGRHIHRRLRVGARMHTAFAASLISKEDTTSTAPSPSPSSAAAVNR